MWKSIRRLAIAITALVVCPGLVLAQGVPQILVGGNGGHNNGTSINDGSLVVLDQNTAATAVIGHPVGVARLTGLAFNQAGDLYASATSPGGFPPPPENPLTCRLLKLDPDTGKVIKEIGDILDGPSGPPIAVSDISFQPGTDTLFAVRSSTDHEGKQGMLYTIDVTTGIASEVGDTGTFFPTITFGPDGTLWEVAAELGNRGPENAELRELDPNTGDKLSAVPLNQFYGALAVRKDGEMFASTGDGHELVTLLPSGQATKVGDTGRNYVGGLAFRSLPGPCDGGPHTLCLNNGRFQVNAQWGTAEHSGDAGALQYANKSGAFWFFEPDNWEVMVKVLDGCNLNDHFWVFTGSLTNVEYTISVVDRDSGHVRTYSNQLGTPAQPIQDTSAFATCP